MCMAANVKEATMDEFLPADHPLRIDPPRDLTDAEKERLESVKKLHAAEDSLKKSRMISLDTLMEQLGDIDGDSYEQQRW